MKRPDWFFQSELEKDLTVQPRLALNIQSPSSAPLVLKCKASLPCLALSILLEEMHIIQNVSHIQFKIFKHQMKFKISQLLHYILYQENTSLGMCQSLYLMQILGTKCLVSKKLKPYKLCHRSSLPFQAVSHSTGRCLLSKMAMMTRRQKANRKRVVLEIMDSRNN